jgi:hypothetical protein
MVALGYTESFSVRKKVAVSCQRPRTPYRALYARAT